MSSKSARLQTSLETSSAPAIIEKRLSKCPRSSTAGTTLGRGPRPVTPPASVASVEEDVVLMPVDSNDNTSRPLLLENRLMVAVGLLEAGMTSVDPLLPAKMGELLGMQTFTRLDALDFVVGRYVLVSSDDEWELTKTLFWVFEGNNPLQTEPFHHQDGSLMGNLWWRAGVLRGGHLAKSKEVMYRVLKNRSFIWATPLISVWPPPLVIGLGIVENTVWCFELTNHDTEHSVLVVLAKQLEPKYCGYFYAKVCDGWLSYELILINGIMVAGQ